MNYVIQFLLSVSACAVGSFIGCWIFQRFLRRPHPSVLDLIEAQASNRRSLQILFGEVVRAQAELESMRETRQ